MAPLAAVFVGIGGAFSPALGLTLANITGVGFGAGVTIGAQIGGFFAAGFGVPLHGTIAERIRHVALA